MPTPFIRAHSSRKLVQAGDLIGSSGESIRPFTRGAFSTPRLPKTSSTKHPAKDAPRLQDDDFDLRDEVMNCIAKSIGLHQPPLSAAVSPEASPAFGATPVEKLKIPSFPSSFGSLSNLMGMGDDASTMTGASSVTGADMSGLDNDVEILFFAADSTLARAGERNTGMILPLHLYYLVNLRMQGFSMSLRYSFVCAFGGYR
jgi:lysophospholipid hydrolase